MDEARIESLIENIYSSVFEADGWDSLLQTMRTEFHASQVTTQVWGKAERAPLFTSSSVGDPSARRNYLAYYHTLDPTYPGHIQNPRKNPVFSGAELVDYSSYLKSEFYCDFFKGLDMALGGHAILENNAHQLTHFHVHRPVKGRKFDDKEIKLLAKLRPHLGRGLRIHLEFAGLRGKAELFDTAFDALAATFLLNSAGRVVAQNKDAEELLRDGSVLTVCEGRLTARHPPDDARLAAVLVPPQPGVAPAEIMLRGSAYAPAVRLAITPADGRAIPLFSNITQGEQVAFLVTATPLGPTAQSLTARFGLTRAEAEVTLMLCAGAKAPQIAAHRQTSTGTVNNQLKQIYAKTGVAGQVELLVKLTGR
ncbi:MAG: helix-turn-helix transcriptional regulator [Pseudomonadota bacterium]